MLGQWHCGQGLPSAGSQPCLEQQRCPAQLLLLEELCQLLGPASDKARVLCATGGVGTQPGQLGVTQNVPGARVRIHSNKQHNLSVLSWAFQGHPE